MSANKPNQIFSVNVQTPDGRTTTIRGDHLSLCNQWAALVYTTPKEQLYAGLPYETESDVPRQIWRLFN